MIIQLSLTERNMTPAVVAALAAIKENGGGELHFEKGEYHFYKEGTVTQFFVVSNNSACEKHMVFPILQMQNLVIDGHGSVFVFHDVVFPFMISHSDSITVRNMTVDTGKPPLVELKIHGISDDGFYMDIDREESPFFIENGSLCFQRESHVFDGRDKLVTLHALNAHRVQYMATGACRANQVNLPAPLMKCDISQTPTGIYARYHADTPSQCRYGEETVTSLVDGGRSVDVICLDHANQINITNVSVARGIGMGIVGQLSSNIRINGFSTDIHYHPHANRTLTADALHFINCSGTLDIQNCSISDTMDDAINVHGMYTILQEAAENTLHASIGHYEQYYFMPYLPGDRLEIIHSATFAVVAEFYVESACFQEGSGTEIILKGRFTYGKDNLQKGYWIENPDRMPNLHLHHNCFQRFPHNRISGGGEILVEDNRFSDCHAALLCLDLARYWYESGRVKHLVYRNNILDNCGFFIKIGIDGIADAQAPKIHKRIEITGNRFSGVTNCAVTAGGVQELIVDNNIFE